MSCRVAGRPGTTHAPRAPLRRFRATCGMLRAPDGPRRPPCRGIYAPRAAGVRHRREHRRMPGHARISRDHRPVGRGAHRFAHGRRDHAQPRAVGRPVRGGDADPEPHPEADAQAHAEADPGLRRHPAAGQGDRLGGRHGQPHRLRHADQHVIDELQGPGHARGRAGRRARRHPDRLPDGRCERPAARLARRPRVRPRPQWRREDEVQVANYCGTAPALPTTIAFVLPSNAGKIEAAPGPGGGVPGCTGGPGSPGDIAMNGWAT